MNYVRLLTRVGDIAAVVTECAKEQTRMCLSANRLTSAGQLEDARLLLAKSQGVSEANDKIMAVIRDIFREMELDRREGRE